MIYLRTRLNVADNSGVKKVKAINVIGQANKPYAEIGDVITVHIRQADPGAVAKKGTVVKCVVVRTKSTIKRPDGTCLKFDSNAVVLIDNQNNPRGTRVFGPVARELRDKQFMKIISLAPEVV